jgi:NDP-sugar pyrophosphorylase family protein
MVELPAVFVLAAGLGTRLGHHTAKTLYPVAGRPLLDWILTECESQGVRRVTVTVLRRHLDPLTEFLASRTGIEVSVSVDETPEGTLGTLRRAWSAERCGQLLIWLGDVVGRPPLHAMSSAAQGATAVLLAHRRADYEHSGVITVGRSGGRARSRPVVGFREKPGRLGVASARVWAGVAVLDAGALDGSRGADLGRDLWPRLAREGRCRVVDSEASRPIVAVDRPRDGAALADRLPGMGAR